MLGLLLNRLMKQGTLSVIHANGKKEAFGFGEPRVTIRLHDRRAMFDLLRNPDLVLGELYMDGRLTVENGTIADLLSLLMLNLGKVHPSGLHKFIRRFRTLTRRFSQAPPAGGTLAATAAAPRDARARAPAPRRCRCWSGMRCLPRRPSAGSGNRR